MYVSPGEHNKLAIPNPIPVGTVLECQYEYKFFTYTSYNGVNGWIITETGYYEIPKIAYKSDDHIITTTCAVTYSQPNEFYKKAKTIPQNTELQEIWCCLSTWGEARGYVMVTYDNENVWIRYEDVAYETDEVYDETIEFSEDLIIDGETLISKGEKVKLYSKYSYSWDDYYFTYKDSGFWKSDIKIFYPTNFYVIFFEDYKGLPINQKIKVKYYRMADWALPNEDEWFSGRFYFEYNNKIYDMKVERNNIDYIIINEEYYDVYSVVANLNVTRSPYDNEGIGQLSSGDMVYEPDTVVSRKTGNRDYIITEKGISGFANLEEYNENVTEIAQHVLKNELSSYAKVSKSDTTQFINVENSGEYLEYLKYNLSGDYVTNNEIIFTINFFGDEPQEVIVPAQSKITMLGTAAIVKNENENNLYYQVSYDAQSGYAKFNEGDLEEVVVNPSGELTDSGEDRLNIFDIQNKKKEASNLELCILCICGAGILALTAVITIKLINKSSDKNSDELNDKKEDDDSNT